MDSTAKMRFTQNTERALIMKAWLQRIWSWLSASFSATDGWEEEEERNHQEQEEQARLERERRNRRGETDGFRLPR